MEITFHNIPIETWNMKRNRLVLFSLVQNQIQSLNPGFGPKLILKLPSTPTTTTPHPPTQTFLPEGMVLG